MVQGFDQEYSRSYESGKHFMWGTEPEDFVRRVTKEIAKRKASKKQRILDLGCGEGRHCGYLSDVGYEAVGLDVSRVALHRGLRDAMGWSFGLVMGDCTRLPFKKEVFDVAIDVFTLEFVRGKRRYVEEVSRILQPGGFFFIKGHRKKTGTEPHSIDQISIEGQFNEAGMKLSSTVVSEDGRGIELEATRSYT